MSDESKLREKAREAIRTGKLPNRRPDKMWGGPGVGSACTICGARVNDHEVELELQFARSDHSAGRDRYHVHVRCFAAWEFELEQIRSTTAASVTGMTSELNPAATVSRRVLPEKADVCKIAGNGCDATYKQGFP